MDLFDYAKEALDYAYAPYSKFKVSAAILLKNGKVYTGCNIENVSYPLSMCAERIAIYKAISDGYTKDDILEILVLSNTINPISPCGGCRQVMVELLNKDTKVILTNMNKDKKELKVSDLLPYAFIDLR